MARRTRAARLALHILLALAALPLTEGIVRVAKPQGHALVRPQMTPDPELGQIMRPHVTFLDTGGRPSEYRYHVSTNDIGLRMDRDVGDAYGKRLTLVLGDSHVFGWGSEVKDSFFGKLREAVFGHSVLLNGGHPGHSTGHSTLLLRRLFEDHAIEAVAYFLPAGALNRNMDASIFSHARGSTGTLRLVQRPPHGEVKRLLFAYTPWVWLNQNSHLFVYVKELLKGASAESSPPAGRANASSPETQALKIEVTLLHVEQLAVECAERGVPLLVVWQPAMCETKRQSCPMDYRRVKARLVESRSFEFFDPTRSFRAGVEAAGAPTHFTDGHLTSLGNALFFEALRDRVVPFLTSEGVISDSRR